MTDQPVLRPITIDPGHDARWDAFVRAQEPATAYHLGAWAKVLRGAYGYRPRYVALETADGELAAVMPLFYGRGLLTKARLSSMPVARVAGPLGGSLEQQTALIQHARSLADTAGIERLLVRSTTAGLADRLPLLEQEPDQPTWRTPLPSDEVSLMPQLRESSKRVVRSIAKAEKAGVTVRLAHSHDDLRRFYKLYLQTMRKHGALPRSFRQLSLARKHLGPDVFKLFVAELDDKIIAGGVFHAFGDTLELLYNASEPESVAQAPNFALYSAAMRWAIEAGYRTFDFGGALEGSSLGEFKRRWGAEPVPIWLYEYLTDASARGQREEPPALSEGGGSSLSPVLERSPLLLTRLLGAAAYRFG